MALDLPNMGDYGIRIEMDQHAPGKLQMTVEKQGHTHTIGEIETDEVRAFLDSVKVGEFDDVLREAQEEKEEG